MKRFESLQINDRPVALALFRYEDHFYDAALRRYDFKSALHLYLKRNGYSTIIFFSIDKGLHSFEKDMLASFVKNDVKTEVSPTRTLQWQQKGRTSGHFGTQLQSQIETSNANEKDNDVQQDKEGFWVAIRCNKRDGQIRRIQTNLLKKQNCVVVIEPSYSYPEFLDNQYERQTQYLGWLTGCLHDETVKNNGNHLILLANTAIDNGNDVPQNLLPSNHGTDKVKSSFWTDPFFINLFFDSSNGKYSLKKNSTCVLPCPTKYDIINAFQHWRIVGGKKYSIKWHEIEEIVTQLSLLHGNNVAKKSHTLMEWESFFNEIDEVSYDSFKSFGVCRSDNYRKKLSELIGMKQFKQWIDSFENRIKIEKNFSLENNHIFITGNPGTGKTTVAQIIGGCLYELGLLSKNTIVEVGGTELKSDHIGGAAKLVNEKVDEAMGGVLFIDEAYSMTHEGSGHGNDPLGREAIDTLNLRLTKDGDKFIAIVAGYRKQMLDWLKINKGLPRRFGKNMIHLEDYNSDELEEIFYFMLGKKGKQVDDNGRLAVSNLMKYIVKHKPDDFGNAGWVNIIIDKLESICIDRISKTQHSSEFLEQQKDIIIYEDFKMIDSKNTYGWHPSTNREQEEGDCMKRLNRMVGLSSVKTKMLKIKRSMEYAQKHPDKNNKKQAKHFCFYGNPGTGKTTVAKLLGEILCEYGVCETNKVICCDRSSLVAEYQGQTAQKTNAVIDSAFGGVLFIDEIYLLAIDEHDSFGKEARDTLLKRLEDDRDKFTVILAGYKKETEAFLSSNTGLKSRITDYIVFEDYTPEELHQIMNNLINDEGFIINGTGDSRALDYINQTYQCRDSQFGNARWVRTFVEKMVESMKNRVVENGIEGEMSIVITEEDVEIAINEMNYENICV